MSASLIEIEQQASQLPASDRAKLVEFLLESLQEPAVMEVEREWAKELAQRTSEYESGNVLLRSASEVFAQARQRAK